MQFLWVYWHNGAKMDEIRWSMRSVLANYQGKAELIVVGDKPPWYNGPHIPVKRVRKGRYRGFRDSLNKLMIAAASKRVRDEFVWMMDDIYFNKPITDDDLKTHYFQATMTEERVANLREHLSDPTNGNKWQRLKLRTFERLQKEGLPMLDYGTHLPQFVEKKKFKQMIRKFDPSCSKRILLWEVLYGNLYATKSIPSRNVLFRTLKKKPYTSYKNTPRKFLNNGNRAWDESLRGYLYESFPNPSPFETNEATKPYFWYKGEKPIMNKEINKIVAVVPWRANGPERDASRVWVQAYLEARCDEVVYAATRHKEFNRAAAINAGVRQIADKYDLDQTILVIVDADCCITGLRFNEATQLALHSNRLVLPHDSICRMTKHQSDEVLLGKDPKEGPTGRWFRDSRKPQCPSGLSVIKLSKFIEVNGYDEMFRGWGGEDNAFNHCCSKLLGSPLRMDGPMYHFWHPKAPKVNKDANQRRYMRYKNADAHGVRILNKKGYA